MMIVSRSAAQAATLRPPERAHIHGTATKIMLVVAPFLSLANTTFVCLSSLLLLLLLSVLSETSQLCADEQSRLRTGARARAYLSDGPLCCSCVAAAPATK